MGSMSQRERGRGAGLSYIERGGVCTTASGLGQNASWAAWERRRAATRHWAACWAAVAGLQERERPSGPNAG